MPLRPRVFAFAVGLVLLGALAGAGRATLVWDEAGPADAQGALLAVAIDPDDSRVVWVTDGVRAWVTDDGGDSWLHVLRATTRTARQTREQSRSGPGRSQAPEEDLLEGRSARSLERFPHDVDPEDAQRRLAELQAKAEAGDEGARPGRGAGRGERAQVARAGTRLRVLGDRVYLCGPSGLWSFPRAARGLGTEEEIRVGRRAAVTDIALTSNKRRYVATARGLYELDDAGIATPAPGVLGRTPVLALLPWRGGLLAAGTRGLWDQRGLSAQRLGIADGRRPVLDLIAVDDETIALATGDEVRTVRWAGDGPAVVAGSWPLAGARRLALGAGGTLWAAGPHGVWHRRPGDPVWMPANDGLRDRNMTDVVAGRGPAQTSLWLTGRAGSWRRVSETRRLLTQRGRAELPGAPGIPSAWEMVQASQRQRHAETGHMSRWRRALASAWLLPEVVVSYQVFQRRLERGLVVPELDRTVLSEVRIAPYDEEFRVVATWDLFPVMWAMLDLDTPYGGRSLVAELQRVLRDREAVRERVVPLYNRWTEQRTLAQAAEPTDVAAALRQRLALHHTEADLHVLTGGVFALGTAAAQAAALPQSPSEELPTLSHQPGGIP